MCTSWCLFLGLRCSLFWQCYLCNTTSFIIVVISSIGSSNSSRNIIVTITTTTATVTRITTINTIGINIINSIIATSKSSIRHISSLPFLAVNIANEPEPKTRINRLKKNQTQWKWSVTLLTGTYGRRESDVVECDVSERVVALNAHDLDHEFRGRADAEVSFRPVRGLSGKNVWLFRRF